MQLEKFNINHWLSLQVYINHSTTRLGCRKPTFLGLLYHCMRLNSPNISVCYRKTHPYNSNRNHCSQKGYTSFWTVCIWYMVGKWV